MESILIPTEIDLYVSTMQPQLMENIGTKQWMEWHQRIQKLNQEAVIQASAVKDESVKEMLVSFGKITVLVHEAILINIWKNKILPLLLRIEPNPSTTFVAYSVLYHEAVCVALLELIMYHGSASEALGDAAIDLLDYVYGTISQLLVIENTLKNETVNDKDDIKKHQEDLSFAIGIRSITIMRYLAENLDRLPLSITDSMFNTNDIPVFLVQILLKKPWLCEGKQYIGGQWIEWDGEVLIQVEGQVWLTVRQLLLDSASMNYYEITESRRSQLLKLQPLLSPCILDQLSPLIELQQWLYRLAVSNLQTGTNRPILIERVLEIKTNITEHCKGKWKTIAQLQLPLIFCQDHEQLVQMARGLSETYNTELMEKFENIKNSNNKCSQCGKRALQRCSNCKNDWYCSRNCQVSHWPHHKIHCIDIL